MENDSLMLNPNEWDYLHEGNQHLILKHVGDNQIFVGKVLRLKKSAGKNKKTDDLKPNWWEKWFEESKLLEKIESDVFGSHPIISQYHLKVKFMIFFKAENFESRK
jgi:hypothetical protein